MKQIVNNDVSKNLLSLAGILSADDRSSRD